MQRSHTLRPWALLGAGIVFLAALSWVPYRFPVPPSVSDSYFFGYNNRIAQIIVAVAVVLLAWLGPEVRPSTRDGKPLTRNTLYVWLGITFAVALGLHLATRSLEGFGDSIFLIDRIKLLLAGRQPYIQFEYPYGVAFLYGPAWMVRWFHLSVGDAYGLFWMANGLLGTLLLYATLQGIDAAEGRKRTVFLFFSAIGVLLLLACGVNYTLLRYITPCYLAVQLYRLMEQGTNKRRNAFAMLLGIPCYGIMLLITPELAISLAAGIIFYFAVFGHLRNLANAAAYIGFLAGVAALSALAAHLGVFLTMATYRTGAYNLPIMPAPHLLVFWVLLSLAACYAAFCVRQRNRSVLLLLMCISAPGLAGALGRCDSVHVLFNATGVVLAATLLMTSRPWFDRILWWGVWAVFLCPSAVFGSMYIAKALGKVAVFDYISSGQLGKRPRVDAWIMRKVSAEIGPDLARRKLDNMQVLALTHGNIDVNRVFGLPGDAVSEAPFGFAPTRFGTYLTPAIDTGYFFEHQNMGVPRSVERKVDEMRAHPERRLLLLPDRELSCSLQQEVQLKVLSSLFLYPYRARVVNPGSVTEPLCEFIRRNYHVVAPASPEHFDYALWSHN